MKLAAAAPTDVTYAQLKWMSAALALALAAHAAALPVWALGVAAAAIALRLSLAARGLAAPARSIRLGIALVSITLMFLQYHTFNGVAAGGALLSLVAGLKLLETQSRRDLYVLSLIIYFLNLGALLRSESFWLFAYVVGASWFTTAALLRLTPTAPLPAWRLSMRYAGRVAAQALPLALVLWLFFPRFDGPLWQMPLEGRGADSGLSDSMSPGDITELALSDDIAFRVRFTDPPPPPEERYWRGPVLHDFDGHTWRGAAAGAGMAGALVPIGRAYSYTLSLEPHAHNWLFALDWPDRWDLASARLTGDYTLVQPDPVSRHLDISAASHTRVESAEPLSAALRERDVDIPRNQNPRTLALAAELRRTHPDDRDYARAVLAMFREQQFFYTLEPPPLGADSIDAFLFDTKRGYCGHYASAFAVLMRAAGVPTRVVTGYQGGAFNRYAGDWIVRQSNAHAWDEIWIDGTGWQRVDPTSAIAPARVERGLADALTAGEPLTGRWGAHLSWLADLRLRMDALGQLWRRRILGFDQLSQNRLLEWMGIPEPGGQKIVLVLGAGLVLAFAWLTWQVRRELRPQATDPLLRAYARLCVKLAAIGLPREAHEGAEAFAARVARARPDLARQVTALCRRYSQLRYGASPPGRALESFTAGVRAFRPRRSAS
jgi:transglutaminase-like putative cysteine protease